MGNIFDNMRDKVFDITTNVMGYDATYNGYKGRVHFREITEKDMILQGVEFSPLTYYMEFRKEDFPGLELAARSQTTKPIINIEGINYHVNICTPAYDGRYFKCYMNKDV